MSSGPDGSTLDVVVPADANTKLAVLGVEAEALASSGAVSRREESTAATHLHYCVRWRARYELRAGLSLLFCCMTCGKPRISAGAGRLAGGCTRARGAGLQGGSRAADGVPYRRPAQAARRRRAGRHQEGRAGSVRHVSTHGSARVLMCVQLRSGAGRWRASDVTWGPCIRSVVLRMDMRIERTRLPMSLMSKHPLRASPCRADKLSREL